MRVRLMLVYNKANYLFSEILILANTHQYICYFIRVIRKAPGAWDAGIFAWHILGSSFTTSRYWRQSGQNR